ncbi:MAG: CRTAC1 family protein [Bryobacteraceae bacterium]
MKWILLAALAAAVPPPIVLEDVTARSGIGFVHRSSATSQKYLIETMSGGVALIDYDGDGWLDIFFVNGAQITDPMPPGKLPDKSAPAFWNRLYRNRHDGTFADVTESARVQGRGFDMGAAAADFDNDGHADLFVTGYPRNRLYRNMGDGTFRDVTEQAGVAGGGWSAGALWIDYDLDGRLDLIVTRYLDWSFNKNIFCGIRAPVLRRDYCHPDQFQPIAHLVYHNEGGGRFRDASLESGIGKHPGKGLGIAMADFDLDGWPDVFIANDAVPQQLFRNRHDGTFEEVALAANVAYDADGRSFSGMGADFADYDNDGWPDLFADALALQRYALFRNRKGTYEYSSGPSGVAAASVQHSGWGAKFADFDNDGWKDLFVAQGHVMDNIEMSLPQLRYLEAPLALRNVAGRFAAVASFAKPIAARGAAFGDLNNDGWPDVVINCNNQPPVILENRSPRTGRHFLMIDAGRIGARVRVVSAGGRLEQHAMVTAGGSYLSSNDARVHFGLGGAAVVDSVEVTWPSGKVRKLANVKADQFLRLQEPD